jgi:hypothetical protein
MRLDDCTAAVLFDEQLHALDDPGLPHATFLAARRLFASRYDGPEFTLLRFENATDVTALEAVARDTGVPLRGLTSNRPIPPLFVTAGCYCRARTSTWPARRSHAG